MTTQVTPDLKEWETLMEEGNASYAKRKFSAAELKFIGALRIAEKWAEAKHLEDLSEAERPEVYERLGKSLNNMAALYYSQGKYKMAEDLYNRCLKLKKELHGDEHLEIAVNLHNLAVLYCGQRRFEEAQEYYKQALAIKERILGSEHVDLVGLLENYALLLKRTDKEEETKAVEERVAKLKASSTS